MKQSAMLDTFQSISQNVKSVYLLRSTPKLNCFRGPAASDLGTVSAEDWAAGHYFSKVSTDKNLAL